MEDSILSYFKAVQGTMLLLKNIISNPELQVSGERFTDSGNEFTLRNVPLFQLRNSYLEYNVAIGR